MQNYTLFYCVRTSKFVHIIKDKIYMLGNIKKFLCYLNKIWLNFRLQNKLVIGFAFIISFGVINFTFWSIHLSQQETIFNSARLANDINTLLSSNIVSLINEKNYKAILPFCERFYKNSPSIRYIIFFDLINYKNYSIPLDSNETFTHLSYFYKNTVSTGINLTTILCLRSEDNTVGLLILGIHSNQNLINNSKVISTLLIIVFLIFWLTLILGIIFNASFIITALKEISYGLGRIASGNFSQKVNLAFGGDLGNLILQFNATGKKLQQYEENNIDQLMNEKNKIESLLETIADGALLLDTSFRLVLINKAACTIFSWDKKEELVGTKLWSHISPSFQKKMYAALEKLIKTGSKQTFYSSIIQTSQPPNSKFFCIILNIVYDSRNQIRHPKGIAITLQDSTKELDLMKVRSRFIANISHELRTPLFNIRSFIETTQDYNYTLTTLQKWQFLHIVNIESNRLTRLVNNILNFSRLNDSVKVFSSSLNIETIIQQTIFNYQLSAHQKTLFLLAKIQPNISLVQGNGDLLTQVILNLIGNSLKFTYPNGKILLRAYRVDYLTRFKIRIELLDTGIGIDQAFKNIIFNRFVKQENDVYNLNGTGLGLAIVKSILKEHQSSIRVITRQNIGSVFWFDLNIFI